MIIAPALSELDGLERILCAFDEPHTRPVPAVAIYHRTSDDTFWKVDYLLRPSGLEDGISDGTATVEQVEPQTVLVGGIERRVFVKANV